MRLKVLVVMAILVMSPFWIRGQVSTGTITGQVTDSSGAIVRKAEVRITDVGKNVTRTVVTD